MTGHRIAIIDPSAGIAGDMLLGALIDAGASESWLKALPERLALDGVSIEVGRTLRCGVSCARVRVHLVGGRTEHPNPEFGAADPADAPTDSDFADHLHSGTGPHGHHGGDAPHRHFADLLAVINRAPLSAWVRERAVAALHLLCSEEGRVHGVPMDEVALHEVGALDAIVDIVGGIEGFEQLGVSRIASLPLAVGSGWVRTSHGVMPVPTPVTARLVEGLSIGPNGPVAGEATTPTGAVLLRVLVNNEIPAYWRAGRAAWGAGTRDTPGHPNAVRLLLAETSGEVSKVEILSTDLDDLSPEYLEPLREALVAAGALDTQFWGTYMKKGRPGFRIEVMCGTRDVERVTEALFLHTTTAGVRRVPSERTTLPRQQLRVALASGEAVSVKLLETPQGFRVKAEYEDVRLVASRSGRPALDVAREAEMAARAMIGVATPHSQAHREE